MLPDFVGSLHKGASLKQYLRHSLAVNRPLQKPSVPE